MPRRQKKSAPAAAPKKGARRSSKKARASVATAAAADQESQSITARSLAAAPSTDPDYSRSTFVAGGSVANARPLFCSAPDVVCHGCGFAVKVVSTTTGETLRTLEGHKGVVTDLCMHPFVPSQFYSSSVDGTVKLWDLGDGSLVHTYDVGHPVVGVNSSKLQRDRIFLLLRFKREDGKKLMKVVVYDTRAQRLECTIAKAKSKKSSRCQFDARDLAGSKDTVVAVTHKCKLSVWRSNAGAQERERAAKYLYERDLVAVAIQPSHSSPIVATGDCEGRIILWYNLVGAAPAGERTSPSRTSLHWHAHAVSTLAFTGDGNYLLSGGEEAVLVLWQIGTTEKTFLPRLGAPLCRISVSADSLSFGVTTADNFLRVVDSVDLRVRWNVRGLACARPHPFLGIEDTFRRVSDGSKRRLGAAGAVAVDPIDGAIVMNGVHGTGTVQMYDAANDRHLSDLTVAQRNVVSRTQNERLAPTVVEHICFSRDGHDLITVDRLTDPKFDDAVSLKFWERSSLAQGSAAAYTINTRVESPHKKFISALCCGSYRGGGRSKGGGEAAVPLVVTASHDSFFKLWTKQSTELAPRVGGDVASTAVWSCQSTVFFREKPIVDAAFSFDGSLLAVAYSKIVTLWDPRSNALLGALPHASVAGDVRRVIFVGGDSSPHVLAVTSEQVVVWNFVTCAIEWSIAGACLSVNVEPREEGGGDAAGGRFVVAMLDKASQEPVILLFDVSSPVPLYIWRLEQQLAPCHVHFMPCVSADSASCRLLLMNEAKQMFIVASGTGEAEGAARGSSGGAGDGPGGELATAGAFTKLFGAHNGRAAFSGRKRKSEEMDSDLNEVNKFFTGPSHLLPSISSLFAPFMDVLFKTKKAKVEEQ